MCIYIHKGIRNSKNDVIATFAKYLADGHAQIYLADVFCTHSTLGVARDARHRRGEYERREAARRARCFHGCDAVRCECDAVDNIQ